MTKPRIDRVRVDRTEYDALVDLRDGLYEKAVCQVRRLTEHYASACETAASQASRLSRQDLELRYLRERIEEVLKENAELKKRAAALEQYAREAGPVRSVIEQPLFADVLPRGVR